MAVDNVARALAAKAIAGGGAGSSSGSSGSVVQVQADWNINDESNPSFIKNKPFGGDDPVVIFEKNSLDEYYFNWDSGAGYIPCISFDLGQNELTLVDGETYHVKCSSDQGTVEYTGKAKYVFDAVGGFILGDCISEDGSPDPNFNVAIAVGETYDESNPPHIEIAFRNLTADTAEAAPTLTNVSIIIEKGAIKKIPSKFLELPENLEQVQADWSTTVETDPSFIKNKPNIVQSDWNTTDEASISFIKNKPNIPTVYMIYKSRYENGDYSQDFKKELYDAIPNGITMYYIDDSKSSYETSSGGTIYYPITAIHTFINCGVDVNIRCAYTSWSWDTNNKKYVSTVEFLSFSFIKQL